MTRILAIGESVIDHLHMAMADNPRGDELHAFLVEIGARVVHAPEEGPWAPGYYSVLFEDPDGLRLEANFVPGTGLLAETAMPGQA